MEETEQLFIIYMGENFFVSFLYFLSRNSLITLCLVESEFL